MSFYATIDGFLKYYDKNKFNTALDILKESGAVDSSNRFNDESGQVGEDNETYIDFNNLVITIPFAYYRGLSRVLDMIPIEKCHIVVTSTDGCFLGWVITDGKTQEFDLNLFGEQYVGAPCDPDEDFDEYCEWQSEVEMRFFETKQHDLNRN